MMMTTTREYTPDDIQTLPENGVFVFGANGEYRHGKGAALIAKKKFGAVNGRRMSDQSYGIVTKKDWRTPQSSSLREIFQEIRLFLVYAGAYKEKKFYVTKIGSSLAGYSVEQIKAIFEILEEYIPDNVILPKEYEPRK